MADNPSVCLHATLPLDGASGINVYLVPWWSKQEVADRPSYNTGGIGRIQPRSGVTPRDLDFTGISLSVLVHGQREALACICSGAAWDTTFHLQEDQDHRCHVHHNYHYHYYHPSSCTETNREEYWWRLYKRKLLFRARWRCLWSWDLQWQWKEWHKLFTRRFCFICKTLRAVP